MSSNVGRALMLGGVGISLFGISAMLMVGLLPGPHSQKEYFIIGCMSTLVSLGAVFLIVITTWIKAPNPFFRRRKRTGTKMFDS